MLLKDVKNIKEVVLTGNDLSLEELVAVSRYDAKIKVDPDAIDRIKASRALIDDIVDTAGSLVEGAKALEEFGAKSVTAAVTHAVLTDPASERIANSNIKELIVTNTIPLPENCNLPNITQLSVAPLLGEAIMRIFHEVSVSNLFDK